MTEQNSIQQHTSIDSDRVIRHLTRNFQEATRNMGKATRGKNGEATDLYKYQVEMAYMIDEIQRGPVYLMPKIIADANELIAELQLKKRAKEKEAAKK